VRGPWLRGRKGDILSFEMTRDYDALARRAARNGDRAARMQDVADLLWEALRPTGVSWLGFYLHDGAKTLVLGPRRDKPACSPIGLHGACGRAFRDRAPFVVRDVAELGANYIACDPADRSEVVIPLFEADGRCWGVFDADSHEVGAFDARDAAGLTAVLRAAGLTE